MMTLGHRLLRGMAVGLGLEPGWFHQHLTADPLILFRIFRYPPEAAEPDPNWGVAEHTDYGLLTMLRQDTSGGLQVHAPSVWIDAPPIPGTFVCNLGDMLERMTGGRYRSTPHRVRNSPRTAGRADRIRRARRADGRDPRGSRHRRNRLDAAAPGDRGRRDRPS
jgi:isopenicillin N synthase-like dioxygenase